VTNPTADSAQAATTVVEVGTSVEGEVRGAGDLVVRGALRGKVAVEGTVRLEPGADVQADIRAPRVVIVDGASFRGELDTLPGAPEGEPAAPDASAAPPTPEDGVDALRRRIRLRGT
jgi:hypothetical protein